MSDLMLFDSALHGPTRRPALCKIVKDSSGDFNKILFAAGLACRATSTERLPWNRPDVELIPYDGLPSPSKPATDEDVRRRVEAGEARLASQRGELCAHSLAVRGAGT